MKWYWFRWLLAGLLVLCSGIIGSKSALADATYTIRPFQLTADILPDGDANVRETMTYHFNSGTYHGVYNIQDLRGIRGGKLTGISSQRNNGPVVIAHVGTDQANHTYRLTQTQQQIKVKLYQKVKAGDRVRVTYHYHLRGVVKNYRDTAELNWKLIGSAWDVPLHDVRLMVQLPAKHISSLQAWTHGPAAGVTRVSTKAGRVTMTVGSNPANQFIESHLLFPTQVTATNQNRSKQARKRVVQRQEARLASAANAQLKQRRLRQWIGYWVVVAMIGTTIMAAGWCLKRHPANRHAVPTRITHFFDVPQVSPAVAQVLVDLRWPDTNALTGEIMAAVGRGDLKLIMEQSPEHETARLTRVGTVENVFLHACFATLGNQADSFTLAELEAFAAADQQGVVDQWFKDWQSQINAVARGYQDVPNILYRQRLRWFALGVTGLAGVWLIFAWVLGQTAFLATLVASGCLLMIVWTYLFSHIRVSQYNAAGLQAMNEAQGFRRMLRDIGHFNTAEIGDLILWEQILPYAVAFGLAKQVTKQLHTDFGEQIIETSLPELYPMYFIGNIGQPLMGVVGGSIATAISTADSVSLAGKSGGFSGGGFGGSGGFGGGSGGGAF
ncbi:DUF2207 family protein [Levilactobacillus yonginensis]